MKSFQTFKSLTFLLFCICFSNASVIVGKCEEILLASKAYMRYWFYKIGMDILIGFCFPLLRCIIVLLCGFCFFTPIAHITFGIIDRSNIIMGKMFFYKDKVQISKALVPTDERQLFVICLIHTWLFLCIDFAIFQKVHYYC